jgi:hypothetical protein
MNRSRLISLFSAVLLLFAGAETAVKADDRVVGSMLMAAGLIVLGAWIALEVTAEWPRRKQDEDEDA